MLIKILINLFYFIRALIKSEEKKIVKNREALRKLFLRNKDNRIINVSLE